MNLSSIDDLIVEGRLYVNPQLDSEASDEVIDVIVDPKKLYGGIGKQKGKTHLELGGDEVVSESPVWKGPKNKGPFLIVGFDSEYVAGSKLRNRVLSYQYFAILPNPDGSIRSTWSGIGYVRKGERITRSTFFGWVYKEGFKHVENLPKYAVLVGHFTKADVTAFFDFDQMKNGLMAIRNSFISNDHERNFNRVELPTDNLRKKRNDDHVIYAPLRDTYLLCPSLERSLDKVGNLLDSVRFAKLELPEGYSKSRMDKYLAGDRSGFEAYGIRDAEICAHYALRIVHLHIKEGMPANVAATLTGIGVTLLVKFLREDRPDNYFEECFGLEVKEDSVYREGRGDTKSRSWISPKTTENNFRLWHSVFASECYHGGRNEQYFFGPGIEAQWMDYDLSGAYPTAMSMIGKPRWSEMRERQEPDYWKHVQATDLAYFYIYFEFPKSVRFPIFTVRTQNGLLFPRTGHAYCCAPEIVAARELGCEITVIRAVELPVIKEESFLLEFQRSCIGKRMKADDEKRSLEAAFWKEISNSSYGKLAQGLKKKQVFNIKEAGSQTMPPCKVTNPFFAAFTTSFVRATLGEVMNKLPRNVIVSNCTTDGFLCTASEFAIAGAVQGPLFQAYQAYRARLLGKEQINFEECLKIKHKIKQPLGWRTRGQATIKSDAIEPIVLAKAGIRTPRDMRTDEDQNAWILYEFFNRTPESKFHVDYSPSIREITTGSPQDWILTENDGEKRLAMEFDWKRRPSTSSALDRSMTGRDPHLYFDTTPWDNVELFKSWKIKWIQFNKTQVHTLKTLGSFRDFELYVYQGAKKGTRTPTQETEKFLFKKTMAGAFAQGRWGLDKVGKNFRRKEFAGWMTAHGIDMEFYDVENGKKHEIQNHLFPRSDFLLKLVDDLKHEVTPHFDDSQLWREEGDEKS